MKEKIISLLNIKPGETERVKFLFLIQFFSGVAMAFLYTAGSTIFLHGCEITKMPIIYLLSGFALICFNYIYVYFEHHFSLKKTFQYILIFSIFSVLIFKMFIHEHSHGYDIFLLLVWYQVIYYLCGSGFWGIASLIFNVREGKRIFNLIGSGDIPAKLLGYLSVSILVPYIGIDNLLLVSVISFAIALFFYYRFLKIFDIEESHDHEHIIKSDDNIKNTIAVFFGNNLIFFIGVSTIFFAASNVLIDYTFLSEVKHKFYEDESLASFLSKFFAYSRITAVVVKIFLSGKIQQSLGIKGTLWILPISIILFSIGIWCFQNSFNHNLVLYFFGVLMVFTEVIKSTIYEPMFFTLFQPLKPSQRLKGHNITKGIMGPIGMIAMSIFLIIHIGGHHQIDIQFICFVLLGIASVWMGIIFLIEKNYYDSIRKAIQHNSFFRLTDSSYTKDESSISLIKEKLKSDNSLEVMTALQYIYELDVELYKSEIKKRINPETDAQILNYIITTVGENKWLEFCPEMENTFLQHPHEEINLLIGKTLSNINSDLYTTYFQKCNGHKSMENSCVAGALKSDNLNAIIIAGQVLIKKLGSSDDNEKQEALSIIEETENPILYKQIQLLLNEKNIATKKRVLSSIIKIKNPAFLEYIVDNLEDRELKYLSEKCMIQYSDYWSGHIDELSVKVSKEKLTQFLIKSSSADVQKIVLDMFIKEPNAAICDYLYKKKQKLNDSASLIKLIKIQVDELLYLKTLIGDTEDLMLIRALVNEFNSKILYVIQLFYLLKDSNKVYDIYQIIHFKQKPKYAQALELLEYNAKHFNIHHIVTLTEELLEADLPICKVDQTQLVCRAILEQSNKYNDWTLAMALYLGKDKSFANIKDIRNSNIVQEIIQNKKQVA